MTQLVKYDEKMKTARAAIEKMVEQIKNALPTGQEARRIIRTTLTCLQNNSKLLDCDLRSLQGAVMQAAQLGLELEPAMGHAYLVPFKGKVQLITGYKGLINLARRTGLVGAIESRIVYKNDLFDVEYGTNGYIKHRPTMDGPRGDMIAVYASAELKGFLRPQFEVMTREDIDAVRVRSASATREDSPWRTDFDAMCRKSAIRRLAKYLGSSSDLGKALAGDDKFEMGQDQGLDMLPEVPVEPDGSVTGEVVK